VVVVASLLENLPNIAGLARTAEVFGCAELVLANAKVCNESAFQRVSVSAEKWIPIVEIPPHMLGRYLSQQKGQGAIVIGVEQTASSVSLATYRFPKLKKMILVMGQEQQGIPPALLDLVDVCVEIPQHGIIPSLNAHVSASVVLWELVRQRSE